MQDLNIPVSEKSLKLANVMLNEGTVRPWSSIHFSHCFTCGPANANNPITGCSHKYTL